MVLSSLKGLLRRVNELNFLIAEHDREPQFCPRIHFSTLECRAERKKGCLRVANIRECTLANSILRTPPKRICKKAERKKAFFLGEKGAVEETIMNKVFWDNHCTPNLKQQAVSPYGLLFLRPRIHGRRCCLSHYFLARACIYYYI